MKKPDRLSKRATAARVFRIHPDPLRPFVVEVRLARNRRHMREEMLRIDGHREGVDTQGLVRHWFSKIDRDRFAIRPRGIVARMYLNTKDLRDRPSEIVAHECTHAGMAWARLAKANLRNMSGEEVLCHAVGQMVKQVNYHLYAFGVFP